MKGTPTATPPAGERPLYFVNAAVDFACVGGLCFFVYAFARFAHGGARTAGVIALGAQLAWIVNWPHFSATSYRLYHRWDNVRQYPLTALGVPVLVAATVAAALASPEAVAPTLIKLFFIWSPFHFSGQTVGLTMIYARRAGVVLSPLARLALAAFVFGTYLTMTVRAETSPIGGSFYGITYPGLGVPMAAYHVTAAVTAVAGVVCVVAALVWSARAGRRIPLIVVTPAAAQYLWFVHGQAVPSFNEFVPFFHSLQYLLIAWSMQLHESRARARLEPTKRSITEASAWWGAVNFLGGATLFWLIPRGVAAAGYDLAFATGVAIAGVQIHHFFVDGVIWKLRNAAVVSPLLGSFGDLLRPALAPGGGRAAVAGAP